MSLTIARTCASAMYTSTYAQLEEEFHCSRIVATLGLSLFVIGLGLGPMVMSPLSEVGSDMIEMEVSWRLTKSQVLRQKTHLHRILRLLPNLANTMRCGTVSSLEF